MLTRPEYVNSSSALIELIKAVYIYLQKLWKQKKVFRFPINYLDKSKL